MIGMQPRSIGNSRAIRPKKPVVTEEQKQEVLEAFRLFDSDKSGKIDFHELKVCMRALGFDVPKEEMQSIMKEYDRDGSGFIKEDDFMELMINKIAARDPMDEILIAFKLFDDDGTGKISLKNLKRVAKELGESVTDEELMAMIDEFDRDGDGEIDQEDFIAIMKSTSAYGAKE